ncbi:hypothetical protein [Delftia acidovorans]|uniref:Uncharacterized protein n=1 Tax=Delftia acidovorans TaxID=80866 RepID=A0AAJ2QYR5_DELAC|nr:hypothetical protein [Delftia acidovorans]MDX4954023.1 hypothetical protein [Delftia acidovorans]
MTNQDDQLRLLSEAERATLQEDDYDPSEDNAAALAALGRGSLDGSPEGEPMGQADGRDSDDAPASTLKAGAEASTSHSPETDHNAERHGAGGSSKPLPSGYRVDLPLDYQDQVWANKSAMAEVRRRFNDGDLDHSEMEAELDRLQDERDQLRDVKTRATVSAEMRQQSEMDAWTHSIHTFLDDAAKMPELGRVNYHADLEKQADLDAFVKALGAAPANQHRPFRWFLEEAHRRVLALHGIPTTKKPVDMRRRADPSDIVTNLADVPGGAGDADPAGDEFAELDKLTGLDYERALGRLSEEKRAQFLRSV